ncbi:MAG TPA: type I phosphomannose isomerase catalytic subunit [Chthoniobacterales bacterium]|jgi:mannose-6-phosphate isomerase|nr:type I phosphomannose isomerase catalytic subunit [Chthoniobacterales bacterium]
MAVANLSQPLVFEPIFMERVWGGRHLESLYGKRLPSAALIGESWEIVDRVEAQSVVHDGPFRGTTLQQLWKNYRREIFGDVPDNPRRTGSARFPILVKLLDAQENLSLQVHPPAAVAEKLGGESKTEMWYVTHAAPKARIYAGFKAEVTAEKFKDALDHGKPEQYLHTVEVNSGDAIFLPSGRIHALGAGLVIVEIQENSDTTYRIYDWDRSREGKAARQMHIPQAMQCVDFSDREPPLLEPEGETLVRHDLFEVERWELTEPRQAAAEGEFAIVCCISGSFGCAGLERRAGEFCLIPASLADRQLIPRTPHTTILRITMPKAG